MERSIISEWELHGNIGMLTINNPPQNYLEGFKLAHLPDLKRWTEGDTLKGMIIVGKGRHFCAGFNKEDLYKAGDEKVLLEDLRRSNEILYHLEALQIPVVAAMTGVCLGGGLELALSCHIRVCSDKALFSFPETGIGIIPGLNGTVRLPGKIGLCRSLEMVLAGNVIHADEAMALGLVDYVVPSKEVLEFSLRLLDRMTTGRSTNIIRSIMKSINNSSKLSFNAATEEETGLFAGLVLARTKVMPENGKSG